MHQWQSLNLTSWTLLVSLEVRQCKLCYCTRVKLRFLPVYIESLTISSQEPLLGKQVPKQVLYFVKVNTNGKLETRTKGIADKCSDLTCTKKYALTEGPKRGVGKLMWATRSALPVILCLLRARTGKDLYAVCSYRSLQKVGYVPLYTFSQIVVWYTATGLYITVHNWSATLHGIPPVLIHLVGIWDSPDHRSGRNKEVTFIWISSLGPRFSVCCSY